MVRKVWRMVENEGIMCLYPKLIKNPKYRANKKNEGNVPQLKDQRVAVVPIGCGMCYECMKQKANNWKLRLAEEVKVNNNGKFVTLTFSNEEYTKLAKEIKAEGYTLDNEVATLAVRRFLEKWRKEHKKSVRHWLITELGGGETEHLHIHGIIFTDKKEEIRKKWSYGYVWIGEYVSERTVNYITKYVTKTDPKHKYYKPKVLCSKGIGASYTKSNNFKKNKYNGKETKTTYKTTTGHEIALPIYWRNKAYNEEEREQLWINKIEENTRYIMREKISADDERGYYALLKHYRRINEEMGYGSPENWEAEKYEHERRKLMQEKRMKNKKQT